MTHTHTIQIDVIEIRIFRIYDALEKKITNEDNRQDDEGDLFDLFSFLFNNKNTSSISKNTNTNRRTTRHDEIQSCICQIILV